MSGTVDFFTYEIKCPFCGEDITIYAHRDYDTKTGEITTGPHTEECWNCHEEIDLDDHDLNPGD